MRSRIFFISLFLVLVALFGVYPVSALYPSSYFDEDTCNTCTDQSEDLSLFTETEENAMDFYYQGEDLFNAENYEQAIRYFDHVILINPTHWLAWIYKGKALTKLGRYEEAVVATKKAVKLGEPNGDDKYRRDIYAEVWNDLGHEYFQLERYEEALEAFNEAIELDPDLMIYQDNRDLALEKLS